MRCSLGQTLAIGAFMTAACAFPPMLGAQIPHARQPVVKAPPTERGTTGRGVATGGKLTAPAPRKGNPKFSGTFEYPRRKVPPAESKAQATTAPVVAERTKTTAKKKKVGKTHASETPNVSSDTKRDSTRRKP